jgi:ABC-2 type transport system permease protein
MSQVRATFVKTIKSLVRNRAVLLGIVAWPMALTAIMASTALATISASVMPLAVGALTIDMVVFALMLAGIMNFPASIARDREIGLLVKLRSMPISAGLDTLGRVLAYLLFAVGIAGGVTLVGLGLGAQFSGSVTAYLEAVGFLLMGLVAAVGIGLILGSLIQSVQGTAFIGLAITIGLAFTSGIFVPYSSLSGGLQAFSRAFPISSATASVGYLLLGPDVAGYNPLTAGQIAVGVAGALALLGIGLVLYYRTSWRQN